MTLRTSAEDEPQNQGRRIITTKPARGTLDEVEARLDA